MSRTIGRLLTAGACLLLAATATAQDNPGDPDEAALPEIAVPGPEFDVAQRIFGGKSVEEARKGFESALEKDIRRIDQKYGLTPTQRKKLELAGRHDIRRFFGRVEDIRAEYQRTRGDWNRVGGRISQLQQVANQPHAELLGDDSMLAKTLRKTLTPEQLARHEKAVYRAKVEWMAGLLHSRLVLGSEQRRKLVDLVVEETPPLRRYGSFDYDAIMFQMSRLPPERLRTILDEGQCRGLTLRFDQARRMESVLVSEGYLSPTGSAAVGPVSHQKEARR